MQPINPDKENINHVHTNNSTLISAASACGWTSNNPQILVVC